LVSEIIIPFDYFSVSLGLCIASIDLLVNMHKHFAKELQDEARRIKVIFLVLTVSYVSRAVIYILTLVGVIKHFTLVYYVMYIFWDIIPLSLIMYYHFNNFKAQEKFLKKEKALEEKAAALAAAQERRGSDSEAASDQSSSGES